jgi:uncharacterized circularly permuted ATP-grasp superfamily protein
MALSATDVAPGIVNLTADHAGLAQRASAWFAERSVDFGIVDGGRVVQRPIPFDPLPRRLPRAEWEELARGLVQRVAALDCFVRDAYAGQRILAAGLVPRELVVGSPSFLRLASGPAARAGPQVGVAGIDLVRVGGRWLVLEDNLRVPSGVAYALAARRASVELLPGEMAAARPSSVADYPRRLGAELASRGRGQGTAVLLSPGPANAAYYEHRELARQMRVPLVSADRLIASHRGCWLLEGGTPQRVSAIYHRFSPEFLDPVASPESVIGSAFLLTAWRNGEVGLLNAPSCGVADNKAVFAHVPGMIRYYLGEDPLLLQPPTFNLGRADHLRTALERVEELVFKPVGESGGKGIMFGPCAGPSEREDIRRVIGANPAGYVAQPALEVETLPCLGSDGAIQLRRADLRAFVIHGEEPWVMPGGLTRVAPAADSWLVNSSAGGGVKDTWIEGVDGCR